MTYVNINVTMDENLKKEFETWCNNQNIDMETAINIFAMGVVKDNLFSKEYALKVFDNARRQAIENGVADLSMDEIDKEINDSRNKIGE